MSGKPVLLGQVLDKKVQLYLTKVHNGGMVVSARIAKAAAKGILMSCNQSRLVKFGRDVVFSRQWACSLLRRMKFVKLKATTSKSKQSFADFAQLKQRFLVMTVEVEEIPVKLILNWDQTGVKIMLFSTWAMDPKGSKRVEIAIVNDKCLITAVFCGSLTGDFIPVQVTYKGKPTAAIPATSFLLIGTLPIHQSTGPMRKPWTGTFRTSLYHM